MWRHKCVMSQWSVSPEHKCFVNSLVYLAPYKLTSPHPIKKGIWSKRAIDELMNMMQWLNAASSRLRFGIYLIRCQCRLHFNSLLFAWWWQRYRLSWWRWSLTCQSMYSFCLFATTTSFFFPCLTWTDVEARAKDEFQPQELLWMGLPAQHT